MTSGFSRTAQELRMVDRTAGHVGQVFDVLAIRDSSLMPGRGQ